MWISLKSRGSEALSRKGFKITVSSSLQESSDQQWLLNLPAAQADVPEEWWFVRRLSRKYTVANRLLCGSLGDVSGR